MPRLDLNLPDDIHEALAGWAASQGLSKRSAALLLLTRMLAEELGDDSLQFSPPERGGWRGSESSLRNLVSYVDRLTNEGRDDPAESD